MHPLFLVFALHFGGDEHPAGDRWFSSDKAKHFFTAALVQSASFGGLRATGLSRGQSLAGANARVDDQNSIEQIVRTQRDGVSGVSLDEEMANLVKYQRAFQATSRVFNTVDELLDNVVNTMGVGT